MSCWQGISQNTWPSCGGGQQKMLQKNPYKWTITILFEIVLVPSPIFMSLFYKWRRQMGLALSLLLNIFVVSIQISEPKKIKKIKTILYIPFDCVSFATLFLSQFMYQKWTNLCLFFPPRCSRLFRSLTFLQTLKLMLL